MNSKTKSFKKSIFCADMRRFWSFSLAYGAAVFFGAFFDFYLNNTPYGNAVPYNFVNSRFFASSCIANFFGVIAGAVLALILFSYLYSTSSVSFYHGLPFKRKSIFVSKLCSGIVLLLVPMIIVFAIIGITKLCGSYIQIRWLSLFYWFGNQVIYSLLAFSCVTFAAMLSGNILSLLAMGALLFISPAVIIGFIHMACQNYLLGYAYDPTNYFAYFYITPDILLFKARGIIYVIAIPILLIISYLMYKKRDLERCGEAVVFPKLKIGFVYFAGLLGGIFSYFYFSIWEYKSLLFVLPFGIAAVIIANMINRRAVTLKGSTKHIVIYTALILLMLGSFRSDIIGFEKRIPDTDKITSVSVLPDRYYTRRFQDNSDFYKITKDEDIKKVIEYHRHNISKTMEDMQFMPNNVEITYTLKNGRTVKRAYAVNFSEEKEYFEEIADLTQIKMVLYPIYNADNLEVLNIDLHNSLTDEIIYPNNPMSKELIAALNKDIENLPYEENAALLWNAVNLCTPLNIDIDYKDLSEKEQKPYAKSSIYFPISFGFTNTMDVLKKYGYYDRFMTVKNIESLGIDRNDDNKGSLTLKDDTVDEIITDPEKMQEILDTLQTTYRNPVWYNQGENEIYDEYLFLDKQGDIHTFVLYQR